MTVIAAMRFLSIYGLVCLLAACGGQSGSTAATDSTRDSTLFSISPTVSSLSASKIISVTSVVDTQALGKGIKLPTLPAGKYTIVLATDSNDDIIMATTIDADSPSRVFSVDTTAVALVELSAGSSFSGMLSANVKSAILATADYPRLISLLSNAIATGVVPAKDSAISEAILATLTEAKAALSSTQSAQGLSSPTLSVPLPAKVFSGGPLGVFSVRVTAANQTVAGVDVKNGFPINFAAKGTAINDNATTFGSPSVQADGQAQVLLPASELLNIIRSDPEVPIPGGGSAFNLNVFRTPYVQTQDSVELLQSVFSASLSLTGLSDQGCVGAIANAVVTTPIAPWAHKGVDGAFEEFRQSFGNYTTWKDAVEILKQCLAAHITSLTALDQQKISDVIEDFSPSKTGQSTVPFLKKNAQFVLEIGTKLGTFFKIATKVYDFSSIVAKAAYMYSYWDFQNQTSVCLGRNTATAALEVANCAVSLHLDTTSVTSPTQRISLSTGPGHLISVTASDINSSPTLVPNYLIFTKKKGLTSSVDYSPFLLIDDSGMISIASNIPCGITNAVVEVDARDDLTGSNGALEVDISDQVDYTVIGNPYFSAPPDYSGFSAVSYAISLSNSQHIYSGEATFHNNIEGSPRAVTIIVDQPGIYDLRVFPDTKSPLTTPLHELFLSLNAADLSVPFVSIPINSQTDVQARIRVVSGSAAQDPCFVAKS